MCKLFPEDGDIYSLYTEKLVLWTLFLQLYFFSVLSCKRWKKDTILVGSRNRTVYTFKLLTCELF